MIISKNFKRDLQGTNIEVIPLVVIKHEGPDGQGPRRHCR